VTSVPAPDPGPDAGAVWHYGDPLGEQRAAETDAVLVDRSHRAVLTLSGKDRQTWLHSISTQHVSDLPEAAST
jgi:tRNA-modifying protein YgfZ